jgi:hypothetical protein
MSETAVQGQSRRSYIDALAFPGTAIALDLSRQHAIENDRTARHNCHAIIFRKIAIFRR